MGRRNSKVNEMLKEIFNLQRPLPVLLLGSSDSQGAAMPLLESHMEATRLNWFRDHNVTRNNSENAYPYPPFPSQPYGLVNNNSGCSAAVSVWEDDPEVFLGVNGLGNSSKSPQMAPIIEAPRKDEVILLDDTDDDLVFMDSMDSIAEVDNMDEFAVVKETEELATLDIQETSKGQNPSRKRLNPSGYLLLENSQKKFAFGLGQPTYYDQSRASTTRRGKAQKKMKSLQDLMFQSADEGHGKCVTVLHEESLSPRGKDPAGYFQMEKPPMPLPVPNANHFSGKIAHQGQAMGTRPWLNVCPPVSAVAPISYPLPLPEKQAQAPTWGNGGDDWTVGDDDLRRLVKKAFRGHGRGP